MAKCTRCGTSGVFLKVDANGLCQSCAKSVLTEQLFTAQNTIEQLQKQLNDLNASITPEMRNAIELSQIITTLESKESALLSRQSDIQGQITRLEEKLASLNQEIIVANDTIELESFSLYTPKFKFATSEMYKIRLDSIRAEQKEMIKSGTAATCGKEWRVNGSLEEGRKETADNIKLFLRSFNNECDIAVSSVKFSNYDRCAQRITKSFESINKLGRISLISLSKKYLDLKMSELQLAYEYANKKQEEKEEQAEIRRQQREQAKLEKEIAEARKAAEKEKQHYEQALAKLNDQLMTCTDPELKKNLESRRSELKDNIGELEAKLEDIDYRQSNQRAGYVYIISNLGAFGENVYKIGMTRRLNPMDRVDELGDASVPFEFDVHAMIFSSDAPALEAALHRAFESKRINKINRRREYYRVTLDEIKEVVRANHDKTVEFVDDYTAEQYRESIRMSDTVDPITRTIQ